MKKILGVLLLCGVLVAGYFVWTMKPSILWPQASVAKGAWAETLATVRVAKLDPVEGAPNAQWGYTLHYEATESTAVDSSGRPINGPIEQMGMAEQEPVDGQKVRLKYLREEPVIFELLEPLKFK